MDALSRKQAELCRLIQMSPNPEADAARARAGIKGLEQRIPPEGRVSWLSAQIADAMGRHHIDLRSATDWAEGGQSPGPELKRFQKTVTVRASAQDLQAFLEALNKLPFAVIVEDLTVTRDQKRGTVSANVGLATFVLRATPSARDTASTGLARTQP